MTRLSLALVVLVAVGALPCAADQTQLGDRQAGVAQRYQRLEELLLRLADVEALENVDRAALLRRAAQESRDRFVLEKLRNAAASLHNDEFQAAVENQESANKELKTILTLLLSEDRSKRIRNEKERYARLIKDLKRNLSQQRSTRARTENGADIEEVKQEQRSVIRRSESLQNKLAEQNEGQGAADSSSSDDASKEQDSSNRSADQQQQKEASPQQQNQSSPQDGANPQKSAPPQDGQPSSPQSDQSEQSSPSPAEQSPPSSESRQTPSSPEEDVQQRLEDAIEEMRDAEDQLERADREKATEKQREAEENLRAAIDRLERILRQLREEEMERELAKLEARLRKISAMQTKVLDDTVELASTPKSQRNRQTDLQAGNLAFDEKKIVLEADRAMLLLREEGSSVAFPEVVQQLQRDATRVAERLGQTRIDAVTQGIQRDMLASIEEMVAALQQAQRKLEQQRQQQQGQPQQSGQQEQPLVAAIAELKLTRTMEQRIKTTTARYSGLLETGESDAEEVLPLLRDLSDRQNRLYKITRDLVLRRNQ